MKAPLVLGLDIGSSSIKAALVDGRTGRSIARAQSPSSELPITSSRKNWAEQDPHTWWEHVVRAVRDLGTASRLDDVAAIGISYQMHGLVLTDARGAPLRPAIIWCDGRAVELGTELEAVLGTDWCRTHLLNAPGNFTASKLLWVKQHEPELFRRATKMLLPGDWIAGRMSGAWTTTPAGLSEATLWNYRSDRPAREVLDAIGAPAAMIPDLVPIFGTDLSLSPSAAAELGLREGTPLSYRAGDQPNNAFALGALEPGDIAATAGTSGVIYAISGEPLAGIGPRANTFLHVNDRGSRDRRLGTLLCLNGAGILYSWIRRLVSPFAQLTYETMNGMASEIAPGADGVTILPFGNGPERMLEGGTPAASIHGLSFSRHDHRHLIRAGIDGVACALAYGMEALVDGGLKPATIRAAHTNMFQCRAFREIFTALTQCPLELVYTDGAEGAARGAGVGAGIFATPEEAYRGLAEDRLRVEPTAQACRDAETLFSQWKDVLASHVSIPAEPATRRSYL